MTVSSFTSSSETAAAALAAAGSWGAPFALRLAALALGAAALLALRRRLPGVWRRLGWATLFVLLLRLALFANPAALAFYQRTLGVESIGFLKADWLAWRVQSMRRDPERRPAFLAVGNSQVGAIFRNPEAQARGVDVFSVAGMTPLGYRLYQNEIVRVKPKVVILHVSEFDVARMPHLEQLQVAAPTLAALNALRTLHAEGVVEQPPLKLWLGLWAAELLPEYRWRFVFQGWLEKWTGWRTAETEEQLPDPAGMTPDDWLRVHLKNIEENLTAEGIAPHMATFEAFLDACGDGGMKVLVVEGQYHPAADSTKTRALRDRVRPLLADAAARRPWTLFVGREDLYRFQAEEYLDGYHPRPESAARYVERLLALPHVRAFTGAGTP